VDRARESRQAAAARREGRLEAPSPIWLGKLGVPERWCVGSAVSHLAGEAPDSPLVLALDAELPAGEIPLGALSGAAGLDVGGLLACLPSAGDNDV